MWPGASMMMYFRFRVLKKTRAESMVIPWDCSSLSASIRNAYSNGLEFRSQFILTCSSFPSGKDPVSASSLPDDGAFAVIHVADDDDVHVLVFRSFILTCTLLSGASRARRHRPCPGPAGSLSNILEFSASQLFDDLVDRSRLRINRETCRDSIRASGTASRPLGCNRGRRWGSFPARYIPRC